MNRKIYRAVVIVLVVLTIGQIIRFGFQLYGDQYHYHYDEEASLYYAYENIGNAAKAAIAKADMEEAEGRMGDLSYCAEEIDGYFVKYFASADSQSQSTDVEGQSTEAE